MTVNDFRHFYSAIHGYPPFDWQEKLLERVVDKGWPPMIDLPTSSGKTSAIDIAVFHLALQAGLGMNERTAALRTFFVIDRRVVVDEATEHALTIADALLNPKDELAFLCALAIAVGGSPREPTEQHSGRRAEQDNGVEARVEAALVRHGP